MATDGELFCMELQGKIFFKDVSLMQFFFLLLNKQVQNPETNFK